MQTARPHGLDLSRVRLNGKEANLPRDDSLEMVQEASPYVPELCRVLDRRIREDQDIRVQTESRIGRRISDEVSVPIAVTNVEIAVGTVLDERTHAP